MNRWRAIQAIVDVVVRRVRAYPLLFLLRFAGVLVTVALVGAVSLYSATMADALLQASLSPQGQDVAVTVSSNPGDPSLLPFNKLKTLDHYLRSGAAHDLGLPLHAVTAHFTLANGWPLTAWGQNGGASSQSYGSAYLEYFDTFAAHARILAGTLPSTSLLADGSVPVAVPRTTADDQHLHVGQRLGLVIEDLAPGHTSPPLTVKAIYTPTVAGDPFWQASSPPVGADTYELLSERAFSDLSMLSPQSNPGYTWELNIPVKAIHFGASDAIRASLTRFNTLVTRLAPSASTFTDLGGNLKTFAATFALLDVLLYLLAAPVVLVSLYYLTVSTELVMERYANEIVLMRSRGAMPRQVVAIYVVEGILLGILAVITGPFVAIPIAGKIGQTSSFLAFSNAATAVGRPNLSTFAVGGAVAVLAVIATLIPAISAARRTMSSHKQEQARPRQKPLWQRFYLDLVLLLAALYGYYVLVQQGPILPSQNQSAIVQDPFVAIAPTLFVLAGTLLLGRLMPTLSAAVAVLLRQSALPLSMALQTIARTPHQYRRLCMLLSLPLSIGVLAAAVAGTISTNTSDQYRYQAGASLRLVEDNPRIDQYQTLSVAWHLRQPGVKAATPALRFMSYQADVAAGDFSSPIEVLGVAPATFGRVAWFRQDFASKPLPALLALLDSTTQPRVLVNDAVLKASGARVGDQIQLSVAGNAPVMATVVGSVHYFPTMDSAEGYDVIMNMSYLQTLASAPGPSEMWMTTDESPATTQHVIDAAQATGRVVLDYEDSAPPINIVDDPLQVGIYGVTSIGFIITAALSMLGLVAYLYLSMERRAGDFGVLRALGSSTAQVAMMLLLELLFLVIIGVVAALAIGLLGSEMFIPYLPIAQFTTPPFLVNVPWLDVVQLLLILLAAFAVALAMSAYVLTQVQIHRVLRLGEA